MTEAVVALSITCLVLLFLHAHTIHLLRKAWKREEDYAGMVDDLCDELNKLNKLNP